MYDSLNLYDCFQKSKCEISNADAKAIALALMDELEKNNESGLINYAIIVNDVMRGSRVILNTLKINLKLKTDKKIKIKLEECYYLLCLIKNCIEDPQKIDDYCEELISNLRSVSKSEKVSKDDCIRCLAAIDIALSEKQKNEVNFEISGEKIMENQINEKVEIENAEAQNVEVQNVEVQNEMKVSVEKIGNNEEAKEETVSVSADKEAEAEEKTEEAEKELENDDELEVEDEEEDEDDEDEDEEDETETDLEYINKLKEETEKLKAEAEKLKDDAKKLKQEAEEEKSQAVAEKEEAIRIKNSANKEKELANNEAEKIRKNAEIEKDNLIKNQKTELATELENYKQLLASAYDDFKKETKKAVENRRLYVLNEQIEVKEQIADTRDAMEKLKPQILSVQAELSNVTRETESVKEGLNELVNEIARRIAVANKSFDDKLRVANEKINEINNGIGNTITEITRNLNDTSSNLEYKAKEGAVNKMLRVYSQLMSTIDAYEYFDKNDMVRKEDLLARLYLVKDIIEEGIESYEFKKIRSNRGDAIDPAIHEVILNRECYRMGPCVIARSIQNGYKWNNGNVKAKEQVEIMLKEQYDLELNQQESNKEETDGDNK